MSTRKLVTKRKVSPDRAGRDEFGAAPAAFDASIPYLIGVIANRLAAYSSASLRSRFGIGFPEWRIILVLCEEPGATASRICQIVGMDKAAASRGLRDLEHQGLIEPTRETADRRSRAYALTKEGKKLQAQYAPVARRRLEKLVVDLSPSERAQLISMLRRLRDRSDEDLSDV